MISALEADLVTRHPVTLSADPGRVIAKLFLPGEEGNEAHSRAAGIVDRVLALPESEVSRLVAGLLAVFAPRHWDYSDILARHAAVVESRVRAPATAPPSPPPTLLTSTSNSPSSASAASTSRAGPSAAPRSLSSGVTVRAAATTRIPSPVSAATVVRRGQRGIHDRQQNVWRGGEVSAHLVRCDSATTISLAGTTPMRPGGWDCRSPGPRTASSRASLALATAVCALTWAAAAVRTPPR
ncbi:hypothetical protein FRACA_190003 [Frankia canadensis]|uniref:Uncharacterized protein n=1 Tax=Frankia canadensis TaxID=1836972 RepID=A0A2I2KP33_9ACTN|nr:hypothetical protein FRACA_190003 [Frankia canadensis]SOU54714.1 hypothetical protein FRACA_190003 [Frankia canadensis]